MKLMKFFAALSMLLFVPSIKAQTLLGKIKRAIKDKQEVVNNSTGSRVIVYTPAKFPARVQPDKKRPVVIDFNATWCGPCARFAPVFEASAKAHPEAIYYSIDVDENPKASEQFNVSAIPMVVILMPDGTYRSQVGLMDETTLEEFLGF